MMNGEYEAKPKHDEFDLSDETKNDDQSQISGGLEDSPPVATLSSAENQIQKTRWQSLKDNMVWLIGGPNPKATFENRRRFNTQVVQLGSLAAGTAILDHPISQLLENKELVSLNEWIIQVDFTDNNEKLIADLQSYMTSEGLQLWPRDQASGDNDDEIHRQHLAGDTKEDREYTLSYLFYKLLDTYTGHAQTVQSGMQWGLGQSGFESRTSEVVVNPVQESMDGFSETRDELNNPSLIVHIDGQKIGEQLQQSSQKIALVPLQPGENEFKIFINQVDKINYFRYSIDNRIYYSPDPIRFVPYVQGERLSMEEAYEVAHANDNQNTQPTAYVETDMVTNRDSTAGEWYYDATKTIHSDEPEYDQYLAQVDLLSSEEYQRLIQLDLISASEYKISDESRLKSSGPLYRRINYTNEVHRQLHEDATGVWPQTISVSRKADLSKLLTAEEYQQLLDHPRIVENNRGRERIVEPYIPEKARESLLELFTIANLNPDKLIIASGGNIHSFIGETLEELESENQPKPDNLILVGVLYPPERPDGRLANDACDYYLVYKDGENDSSTSEDRFGEPQEEDFYAMKSSSKACGYLGGMVIRLLENDRLTSNVTGSDLAQLFKTKLTQGDYLGMESIPSPITPTNDIWLNVIYDY